MPNFEAKTEIGGAVLAVQDGQVMIYFPEGEGTSEPLSSAVIEKLSSFALVAKLHFEEENRGV